MVNILMRPDKSLCLTNVSTIYQNDSLPLKLRILIPTKYEDLELTDFNVWLTWCMPDGKTCNSIALTRDETGYNDNFNIYKLPLTYTDTSGTIKYYDYTSQAGIMGFGITMAHTVENISYILKTGIVSVRICPTEIFYTNLETTSITNIETQLAVLDSKINTSNQSIITVETEGTQIIV